MIKPFNKIVVVGGGSAGWMSAAALVKAFPDKEITVIESPDYPIIGVGESTLAQINGYLQFLGLKDEDFMKACNATYKMSIKFIDFYDKGAGGFHYPFGTPDYEGSIDGLNDWLYKRAAFPSEVRADDFAKSHFPAYALFEYNKFDKNLNGEFGEYPFEIAYHFDAIQFGQYLKNEYCLPLGVNLISDTVKGIPTGEQGVKKLILSDGTEVEADLYVDCTGFKSLLLGEALGTEFKSYSHLLPNNRAWAAQVPYKNKKKEMRPYTQCTAIENGWVWNTPVWDRIGTGYVYSDNFVDPETAKEEFKRCLMKDLNRTQEEVDQLKFRDVPMRVGIHEKTWVKNVVAIGLSAGFVEPLESNGLYSVHEFLQKLLKVVGRNCATQLDIDSYNMTCYTMFNNFAEFVMQHYALGIRNDTPYWQANTERVYSEALNNCERLPPFSAFHDVQDRKFYSGQNFEGDGGIPWIAAGLNYFVSDEWDMKWKLNGGDFKNYPAWNERFAQMEDKKKHWAKLAEGKPSAYEYLRDTIYEPKDMAKIIDFVKPLTKSEY